jgi:hypothetical protein
MGDNYFLGKGVITEGLEELVQLTGKRSKCIFY